MVIGVLVELSAKTINKTFSYIVPKHLQPKIKLGIRVSVPFGTKKVEGFVLELDKQNNHTYELKEIIDVIDSEPVLTTELLELGKYISKKTLCYLIEAYQVMLPVALKAKDGEMVNIKEDKYIKLNINQEDINNIKLSDSSKQIINMLLAEKEIRKSILNAISVSSVKTLLNKKIIIEETKEIYRLNNQNTEKYNPVVLNSEQQLAINEVKNNFNKSTTYLLHGVTGSGKTEVYMELINEVIKNNKQAIVLVPEISLTPQIVNRFKQRFNDNIAVLHSRLNKGEKYDEWRRITKKEVSIVIGARSAIFAPLDNIGIIIIDEEHVSTYKQENHPRYNAIDIALWRSAYHSCPVILGSATPTLESYARSKKGVYKLLELKNRVNNRPLPMVTVIDMKDEMKKGNRYFSNILIDKINDRLNKKEQIILLLNKRGYTSFVTCSSCGYTDKCPNCDISMTYHKSSNMMRCHYCGYASKKIEICPECKSDNLKDLGLGTEKVEEQLYQLFSGVKVVRMDLDTTTGKGSHEKIINDFKDHKYDILLGTQMIAKGLDFAEVTLVGVLNGDTSLNIPDFRSSERTFQLLNQVSGRAGRKDIDGEVIIQTFNPEHYSIVMAKDHNYKDFYDQEMAIRKELKYSPYYFMALIRILSRDYDLGLVESKKAKEFLTNNLKQNVIILGPSTSNLYKINNVYRFQCIIKYKDVDEVYKTLNQLIEHYKANAKVSIEIDIDPVKI
jgi:primosomal protein N' (replication factor Y) (superfamily II helicase)